MDLTRAIDIYCERIDTAFWAEPVNAVTNLAFILAALYGWRLAAKRGDLGPAVIVLVVLAAAVGTGSFLFHTYAQAWAGMADVIPIGLFSMAFAFVSIRRFFGFSAIQAGAAVLAIIGAFYLAWATAGLPRVGGSTLYSPAVIYLGAMAALLLGLRHPAAWTMTAAVAIFSASLYFRGLDGRICADFPLGTHFLWHIFNGLLFAFLLRAVIVHRTDRP